MTSRMCLMPRSGDQSFFRVFTQISPLAPTYCGVCNSPNSSVAAYIGVEDLGEEEAFWWRGREVFGEDQLDPELAALGVVM